MRSCLVDLKLVYEYLHFVLLIGKTNWIQDLDLAQLDDLSLSPQFESLCGFTQAKMETYLAKAIIGSCSCPRRGAGANYELWQLLL